MRQNEYFVAKGRGDKLCPFRVRSVRKLAISFLSRTEIFTDGVGTEVFGPVCERPLARSSFPRKISSLAGTYIFEAFIVQSFFESWSNSCNFGYFLFAHWLWYEVGMFFRSGWHFFSLSRSLKLLIWSRYNKRAFEKSALWNASLLLVRLKRGTSFSLADNK